MDTSELLRFGCESCSSSCRWNSSTARFLGLGCSDDTIVQSKQLRRVICKTLKFKFCCSSSFSRSRSPRRQGYESLPSLLHTTDYLPMSDPQLVEDISPPTVQSLAKLHGPPPERKRRSHQKSRKGCVTCKKRKVKCSEEKPVCISPDYLLFDATC